MYTKQRRVSPLEIRGNKINTNIKPQSVPTNLVQGKHGIRTYTSFEPPKKNI